MLHQQSHKILSRRDLSPSVFVLRLERKNLMFDPGQFVLVSLPGDGNVREYSVYSGFQDPYIELLIKEVTNGYISKKLRMLNPGNKLEIEGPFGFFTVNENFIDIPPLLFVSTGTGISPFHSFIRSYPVLKYCLIQGVRYGYEIYDKEDYNHCVICTSRDNTGDYHGRVSDYLKNYSVGKDYWCYLSGNYVMIEEVKNILTDQGIPVEHIYSEVHF
jgi:ferredoxin--NADP+ reductase